MLTLRPKLPEDFGEPDETELEKRWAEVERDYGEGVGGPPGLSDALTLAQKWQLVCLVGVQREARRLADEAAASGGDGAGGEGGFRFGELLADDDDLRHFAHAPTRWLDRLRDAHAG